VAVIAAQHAACSIRLHRRLLWSTFPAVEVAVAANPRASSILMEWCGSFTGAWLKLHAATNPSAPPEVIDRLLADKDPYVRRVAAAHPGATSEGLRRLCGDFSQPAWILRAAATNAACPADLSDQLLTWLALGGAGASDPHFDPIACSGHPGSTETNPAVWHANAARQDGAETHPLWRVRAAIPMARARIPISVLARLALDPQPEVRRQSARFRELPYHALRELRADTDQAVARLAESALKNKPKQRRGRPRSATQRGVRVGVAIAILVGAVLVDTHSVPSSPGLPLSSATGSVGSVQVADGVSLPGTIAATRTVAGGGKIDAGTLSGSSSLPSLPFISVAAGTVSLTVTVPGAYTIGPSSKAQSGPMQVDAYEQTFLVLPDEPTSVDVTVLASRQPPITLSFGFDGAT